MMILTALIPRLVKATTNSVCTSSVDSCHLKDYDESWQVLICVSGKVLWDNVCVDECGTGYYQYGSTCEPCPSNCAACTGPNSGDCTACSTGYAFNSYSKCVPTCNEGHYYDGSTCALCDISCKTCSTYGSLYCTSCIPSKTLRINIGTAGQCLTKTSTGYYRKHTDDTYIYQCPTNCATCNDYHYCTTCNTGYTINPPLESGAAYANCV
jgi:hypothetical protein